MDNETSPKDATLANIAADSGNRASDVRDRVEESSTADSWLRDVAKVPEIAMPVAVGRTLGRYRVIGELGRGGMGVVYEAIDLHLRRNVALKCLPGHLVGDVASRRRFLSEALVTAGLEHPGIVPVHDAGETEAGELFYAMKKVSGRPLSAIVAETADSEHRLALLPHVLATADAVAYAHDLQVVHRDIKPSNILVGAFGETMVVDWGLAKRVGGQPPLAEPLADSCASPASHTAHETRAGDVLGTPGYMAPEQAAGRPVDARSDVYALGALLFNVVTGQSPQRFQVARSLRAVAADAPDLAAIVSKAMAESPDHRYASARELAEELRRFQSGQLVGAYRYSLPALARRWLRRHRPLVAGTLVLLSTLAGVAIASVQRIARERDTANAERLKAEAARSQAIAGQNALVLLQARAQLARDPTAALAWLKKFPHNERDWPEERHIAYDAWSRGVARYVYREPEAFTAVAVSNAGEVVAASHAHAITLWEPGRQARRVLRADDGIGGALALTADGQTLLSSDGSGAIRVWDWRRGTSTRFAGRAATFLLAPNGAFAMSLQRSDRPHLLSLHPPKETPLPEDAHYGAFVDDGSRVAIARSGVLEFDDVRTGAPTGTIPLDARAQWVAASRDGERIVAGAVNKLLVLDRRRSLWRPIALPSDGARLVRIAPDGRAAASCGYGGATWTFDLSDMTAEALSHDVQCPLALNFSPDGTKLLILSHKNTVSLWGVAAQQEAALGGQDDAIADAAFSPDGTWIASASSDGSVRLYRQEDGQLAFLPQEFAASPLTEDRAMLVRSPDGALSIRHIPDDGRRIALGTIPRIPNHIASLAEDSRTVSFIDAAGNVAVEDVRTGQKRSFAPAPDEGSTVIEALSSDGQAVAFGSEFGFVHVADVASGKVRALGRHDDRVFRLSFSHDGRTLASGGRDTTLRLWNLENPSNAIVLRDHTGWIWDIRFSRDDRTILTASADGTLRLWDRATGMSRALHGHTGPVSTGDLSPDGSNVVSAGLDGTIRLWWTATGESEIFRRGEFAWTVRYASGSSAISTTGDSGTRIFDLAVPSPSLPRFSEWLDATTSARLDEGHHIVGESSFAETSP